MYVRDGCECVCIVCVSPPHDARDETLAHARLHVKPARRNRKKFSSLSDWILPRHVLEGLVNRSC